MKRDIRIALVSCRSILGRPGQNIATMEKWTDKASRQGAEIICFPELNITGYPSAGIDSISAETVPGKSTEQVIKIAARHGVTILAGIARETSKGRSEEHTSELQSH